jgi:hypothetical protein
MKTKINEAANALCRLQTFSIVVNVLEGGTLPGGGDRSHAAANKIINICKAQIQKELRKYDASVASALAAKKG